MNEWLEAAVLGLLQGFTEFLPVSSSGHLALAQKLLAWDDPDANFLFNVAVHLGSLVAVLWFVRREIVMMFTKEPRLIWVCAVATLPIAVLGVLLKDHVTELSTNMFAVGGFLLVTAALLTLATRLRDGERRASELPVPRALLIGFAQVLAIFPGVSRSGSTLVGGLFTGLEREQAVRFAFLLAVPAIAGAGLFAFLGGGEAEAQTGPLVIGTVVSFLASMVAMRLMVAAVVKRKLGWFAAYCAIVGTIAIVVA